MIDINKLAREIYNGEVEDMSTGKKQPAAQTGNVSNYHNASSRGEEGLSGEDAACQYLEQKGYKILRRNFRCYNGEIDIIAAKGPILSFIEVKTRSSTLYGLPREAVTYGKQKKIRRCAETYLAMTKRINNMPPLSFDVIEVIRNRGEIKSVTHLERCF
ncbi:MAG: YraN family protein [Acidaminococcaceae bacterium]|nr:YraN family protein [Acidaminococcaceae bacterium]